MDVSFTPITDNDDGSSPPTIQLTIIADPDDAKNYGIDQGNATASIAELMFVQQADFTDLYRQEILDEIAALKAGTSNARDAASSWLDAAATSQRTSDRHDTSRAKRSCDD